MKAKFLPLLLLAILLQVSMFSFANEMTSARRIRLKNKTEVQHRSIPVTPDACIENSLLSIDLLSTVPTVTVIIKNAETDEVVYTSTDLNVDKEMDKVINQLVERGLMATPTIIINDRLVYVTNSYEELSRLLEYEL